MGGNTLAQHPCTAFALVRGGKLSATVLARVLQVCNGLAIVPLGGIQSYYA